MTTFFTTVRMTLAVLSISLGATVALAADKKPGKPAKPNAPAAVQKSKAPAIKSPRDVASGQATGRTLQPLSPKSIKNTQVTSYSMTPTNSQQPLSPKSIMDVQVTNYYKSPGLAMPNGTPNGRTKPSNLGDTATHEVGHLKGSKIDPKITIPANTARKARKNDAAISRSVIGLGEPANTGGVEVQNDAGTRNDCFPHRIEQQYPP